ncbi:MAG TPA: acyl-CoA desaturase [Solirubrobacteraceae bacterium]|nr:acyl-CoA desaturase [Solirubrobacteraceae bacterium]
MTPLERRANLLAVVLPFIAFLVGLVFLWHKAVDLTDLSLLVGMYLISGLGITVGFHRLLTHRAFQTYRPLRYVFAILGSLAVQGPVIDWVADHRKHHAHTDEEGDPHSPHVGGGSGLRGLVHAHVGWLLDRQGQASSSRYAKELVEDRGMRLINKAFVPLVVFSLALPFALGWAISGSIAGGLTGLLWGGFVRVFFLHHITWSINSVCHFVGRRRFAVDDHSTNVFWLALPSLGEAWHHNHHAFPRAAAHGMRWWEIDPSGLFIRALRRLGLAWSVVLITPERQRQKTVKGPAASPAQPAQRQAA